MNRRIYYVRLTNQELADDILLFDRICGVLVMLFLALVLFTGIGHVIQCLCSAPHWETEYKDGKATMYKTRW